MSLVHYKEQATAASRSENKSTDGEFTSHM